MHMELYYQRTASMTVLPISDSTEGRDDQRAYSHDLPAGEPPRPVWMLSIACSVLLALLTIPPLSAQIATGGVTGTVKDPTGAVLADAQVTLTNNQTGVAMQTRSTSTGTYVFESVPVGSYSLRTAHAGFESEVINNIDIHIQVVLTQDVSLPVGSTQQQVTVTAASPLLQAENASIGTTIGSREVVDLPLVNRNWASLAQLAAGVTTASTQFQERRAAPISRSMA